MGVIRKTGHSQPRTTGNYCPPYGSAFVISDDSHIDASKTLSNPKESEFVALCRARS